jgi:hypothetical protein
LAAYAVKGSSVDLPGCTGHRMGFLIESGNKPVDGISVFENYDGVGEDRVLFSKRLNPIWSTQTTVN